jgi:hypothetical protein
MSPDKIRLAGVPERLLTSTIGLLSTKLDGHVAAQRPGDTQGETEHQRHPHGQAQADDES